MSTHWQPRATRYRTLALLWILPSVGAVVVLATGPHAWWHAAGFAGRLAAVRFEEWIAFALLLAHGLWVWLAWRHRGEPPVELPPEAPEPGDDAPAS